MMTLTLRGRQLGGNPFKTDAETLAYRAFLRDSFFEGDEDALGDYLCDQHGKALQLEDYGLAWDLLDLGQGYFI